VLSGEHSAHVCTRLSSSEEGRHTGGGCWKDGEGVGVGKMGVGHG
jgi:hypothetical protein